MKIEKQLLAFDLTENLSFFVSSLTLRDLTSQNSEISQLTQLQKSLNDSKIEASYEFRLSVYNQSRALETNKTRTISQSIILYTEGMDDETPHELSKLVPNRFGNHTKY